MRDYAAAPSESLGMSHRPLTDKYLHALRAVARGLADPPGGPLQGCHCMVLTAEGVAALRASGQDAGKPEIGVGQPIRGPTAV
jgi:hypothetical protein